MNAALPESSESSSWSKTCSQASDSGTVTEPATEIRQRESQFKNVEHEPEDIEDKEIDSKSMKVKRDATRRILIDNAPNILTIHLKRFSQDTRGRLSKLSGHVDFRDTIDLRPYIDASVASKGLNLYTKRLFLQAARQAPHTVSFVPPRATVCHQGKAPSSPLRGSPLAALEIGYSDINMNTLASFIPSYWLLRGKYPLSCLSILPVKEALSHLSETAVAFESSFVILVLFYTNWERKRAPS
ncbi:hypothetical protein RJ639_015534 [Escallonia herrerae]|uniref:USP domain-containing protein n=1 Tax=Escallonia herrerae TaxID=1293975 RepID=A0AA89AK35_9ASTE|nr:hypothetical protein RJ639_015534 [Escallonia herrerae]